MNDDEIKSKASPFYLLSHEQPCLANHIAIWQQSASHPCLPSPYHLLGTESINTKHYHRKEREQERKEIALNNLVFVPLEPPVG